MLIVPFEKRVVYRQKFQADRFYSLLILVEVSAFMPRWIQSLFGEIQSGHDVARLVTAFWAIGYSLETLRPSEPFKQEQTEPCTATTTSCTIDTRRGQTWRDLSAPCSLSKCRLQNAKWTWATRREKPSLSMQEAIFRINFRFLLISRYKTVDHLASSACQQAPSRQHVRSMKTRLRPPRENPKQYTKYSGGRLITVIDDLGEAHDRSGPTASFRTAETHGQYRLNSHIRIVGPDPSRLHCS